MKSLVKFLLLRPTDALTLSSPLGTPGRLDSRPYHIALLLSLVAILNGVDLAYTLFAHRIGMLDEMNPLAESFLSQGLEPSLICYKLLMVIAGSTMLWRLRRSGWAIPACWLLIVAYSALAVLWYVWISDIMGFLEARLTWLR